MGNEINSGLLGLAYPSITSAHPGDSQDNTTFWFNRTTYNPVLSNMHSQGLIEEPYFGLVLARTPQNQTTEFGGYLTLGGIPPVPHAPDWSTLPVEVMDGIPLEFTSSKRTRAWWTVTVSSVTFGSPAKPSTTTTNSTSFQAFFDNGNYLSFLPAAVVDSINKLFDPPALFNEDLGAYIVDCNAIPPKLGIQLGSQTFFHHGADLIYQTSEEGGDCISSLSSSESVAGGGITLNIIGSSFYKNAIIVHDFGKK